MGKRKLHGIVFYQCDYTGFPMRYSNCYMPSWDPKTGKLVKKGSYCNWESVLAHVNMLSGDVSITCVEQEREKIRQHIAGITGIDHKCMVPAPAVSELYHMSGNTTRLSPDDYHNMCTYVHDPIKGVKITTEGEIIDIVITPTSGVLRFADYLHPSSYDGEPQKFRSIRKKITNQTAKDLTVIYCPCRDLPANTVASNVFKMQLHGDVIMVQTSKEQSFLPRERFVSYTRQEFCDQFMKKRKRNTVETPAMEIEEYNKAKRQMQEQFTAFEAHGSKDAKEPKQFGSTMRVKQSKSNSFRAHVAPKPKNEQVSLHERWAEESANPSAHEWRLMHT